MSKKSPKPAADGSTKFVSLATGKFVTEAYARRNPSKVAEGVTTLPPGAKVEDGPVPAGAEFVNPSLAKPAKKAVKKKAKKAAKKVVVKKRATQVKPAKKKSTSRIVKRNIATGEFAKKTSKAKKVKGDIIKAPKVKKRPGAKVAKKLASKKPVKKTAV